MIKKAWIIPHEGHLSALSIESDDVFPEYKRLSVTSNLFPADPTPEYPQRHVLAISLLERNDLYILRDCINEYLWGE